MLRLILFAAVLTAGCSAKADGPPAIQVDRTVCAHCTMLVSDVRFAAAYETAAGEPRVFDDIGCLLASANTEPSAGALRFWFHDVRTGEWMNGEEAVFVKSDRVKTPMGGGIIAYRECQDPNAIRSVGELLASAEKVK
jgi:copper chaperone NosL